jgi:drug/metabolite transporter (DMT)-like permease
MTGHHSERTTPLAYLALAAGILCIGTSAIFVKFAAVPGTVSAFYRLLIASLLVFPFWLSRSRRLPALPYLRLVVFGGLLFAFDLVLWNSGILLTSAAAATLLANNAPVWVGLGALLLFRERLSGRFWIGLAVSLGGMALIVGGNAWGELRPNLGDLLSIAASFLYAAYLLTTQKARPHVDTLTFTTLTMVTGVLVLLPVNLATGQALTGFSMQTWLGLAGLGLVSQLAGWLAINYALGHLRAAPVSVSLLAQPVVTAILGILLLGEMLTFSQSLGGALVLAGIYLVNQRTGRGR